MILNWRREYALLKKYCVRAIPVMLVGAMAWESLFCGRIFCTTIGRRQIDVSYIWLLSASTYWAATELMVLADGPVVVRVDSTGGWLSLARKMEEWTHRLDTSKGVRMEIGPASRCMSSCVFLWTSAHERWAHPEARFMFHGPAYGLHRKPGDGLEADAAAMEQAVRRVDPVLADHLKARQAFVPAGPKVELMAAEIAALGGNYLRLDPALR